MTDARADRDEIIDVLIRYATGIDQKDWQLFRTCFTEDVVADYGSYGSWSDAEGLTNFMIAVHEDKRATKHMMTNFVVEVDGHRATAHSYVHAVLMTTDEPAQWIDVVGHYDDHLLRTGKGWQINLRNAFSTRYLTSTGVSGPAADDPDFGGTGRRKEPLCYGGGRGASSPNAAKNFRMLPDATGP